MRTGRNASDPQSRSGTPPASTTMARWSQTCQQARLAGPGGQRARFGLDVLSSPCHPMRLINIMQVCGLTTVLASFLLASLLARPRTLVASSQTEPWLNVFPSHRFSSLAGDPTDVTRFYAVGAEATSTSAAIYLSTDSGRSWTTARPAFNVEVRDGREVRVELPEPLTTFCQVSCRPRRERVHSRLPQRGF